MNIGEFFVTLGVNAETTKVKDFVKTVSDLPLEAAGAIAALGGISFELTKIAEESINAAVGFQMFSNQTGLSSQELQRWQIIAEQANVSGESVAQSVGALQRNLANIRMGRGDIAPFQLLGISANQDAFKVLQDLRQRIQGMDRATATNMVTRMGISADMMNVLTLPEQQFVKFSNTVRGQTEDQTKEFLKAKLALTQFGMVVKELGMNFIANLINAFGRLVDFLERFKGGMLALGIVLGAVAVAFAPMTSALLLLSFILEDLAVWAMGGKSIFKEAFEGLKEILGSPIESLKVLLQLLKDVAQQVEHLTHLDKMTDKLGDFLLKSGYINPAFAKNQQQGMIPAMASAGGGSTTQHNDIDIHVAGSGPAEETAKAVQREQNRAVNAATLQLDNSGH